MDMLWKIANEGRKRTYAIADENDNFMGYISLENDDIPEIGISFLPEFQGKGFGTIACRLLMAQTKEELGISVYTVRIDPTKEKCIKMVAKLGAKKVDSRPSPFMKSLKSLMIQHLL